MSINTIQHPRFGALALIPALALLMVLGAGCSKQEATPTQEAAPAQMPAESMSEPESAPPAGTMSESAPAAEMPAESQAAEEPAGTQTADADGEKIYQTTCHLCHATGVAGAPKLGDKEAWAPRIAKGMDALLSSVTNGLNAMPPKGTCMTCSEDDLRAAVQFMVDQGS